MVASNPVRRLARHWQLAEVTPLPLESESTPPFERLKSRFGRPLHIAILSDFTRIPYANGAAFQTRLLYQELRRCGHQVTIIGPHDPNAIPEDIAPGTVSLPSFPLRAYPGLHIPVPTASWIFDPDRWPTFDLCVGQTTSLLMELGVWFRRSKGVPLLAVNTTHLVAAYDELLPERFSKIESVHYGVEFLLKKPFERLYSSLYNKGDGLMVLSEGLATYWRERGVSVPIHAVPRAVPPNVFDRPLGPDPFIQPAHQEGIRFLCPGRHVREKSQDRIIRIFAGHILPQVPTSTLTLLGFGPDTEAYKQLAKSLGIADRVFFTGEVPYPHMVDYYSYADICLHASLSETYGNVLGEALWCGMPAVAFADGMGTSSQMQDGLNGLLLNPGRDESAQSAANFAFGAAATQLAIDPNLRARYGHNAARIARERASLRTVQNRLVDAFMATIDHAASCAIRPVVNRPKVLQWLTALDSFRPWSVFNGGLLVAGAVRAPKSRVIDANHPQLGTA